MPTAVPTNTAAPEPTKSTESTATVEPTKTPTPKPIVVPVAQSGDKIYATTFNRYDVDDWDMQARDALDGYKIESHKDGLYIQLPDDNDYWIAYYDNLDADVRIEADVEKFNGTNFTYLDIYCRATEEGMYVFQLDTGGFWYIAKYDFNADEIFTRLAAGTNKAIRVGNNTNHMTVVCKGDELIFTINGELIASVQDPQFPSGGIGIGAETFDIPFAEFMFHKLEVFIP